MQDGSDVPESRIIRSDTQRNFGLQSLFFQNGCFIIISEDQPRIGALSVSIGAAGGKVNTAKIIPSKYDSIFINTISEKVSSMLNGICLVSLHSKTPLQLDDMKAIMEEIMSIVGSRKDSGSSR
ncbi:MAG TPA: hypothetical protein VIB07_09980 [Nitrososphaera sp.]|jgi:hypothetical protein